jgi:Bacterial membrane protein YfhO
MPLSRLPSRLTQWRGAWLAAAVLIATLPVIGMFSNSSVFAVRDLAIYFWPKHRWLRDTILSGQWPWWDPYMASGQSAAADALLQMFFLPTLALRLLLPEVLGFNLWIGLPFPIAATGMYLFARQQLSRQASALAAIIFAVSGPIVAVSNFPNVSWSAAAMPWVLWSIERILREPSGRALATLAVCVAAQLFAGEPVSFCATMALAIGYAAWRLPELPEPARAFGPIVRRATLVIAGCAAGLALAAIQLWPLMRAAARSPRSVMAPEFFWSLHPATLIETIAPYLFGDNFQWGVTALPWMRAIGSGRDPFFYSVYLGVPVCALALLGLFAVRRRWAFFWTLTFIVAVVLSFGVYTPIYPALQQMLSLMRSFRYPPKFLLVAMLALAIVAGHGWQMLMDAVERQQPVSWRIKLPAIAWASLLAIVGYAATMMALLFRGPLIETVYRAAVAVGVREDMPVAVQTMVSLAEPQGRRLLLIGAGTAFLVWLAAAGRRESRWACAALFCTVCADLVVTNAHVNQTLPVEYGDRPEWIRLAQARPADRVYFGARLRGWLDARDIDTPVGATAPAWATALETRTIMLGRIAIVTSEWRVRDALSFDLPSLFPLDYELVVRRFESATREERLRFLSVAGVRSCVMPVPPSAGAVPLTDVPGLHQMRMYDCNPTASRLRVVPPWGAVEPDVRAQIETLFRPGFDVDHLVLLRRDPPPPAGTPGPPAMVPYARFLRDAGTAVDVAAGVGAQGGFLVLSDSYDEDWHVEVDGQPTPLLQADAIYRAVRLVPGEHTVRFRYEPQALIYGALVSGSAFLGLCLIVALDRREREISSVPVSLSVALDRHA